MKCVSYVLVSLSLAACASAGQAERPRFSSGGRNVLTAAEIVASRVTDVYQAVSQLRPDFLRRRAAVLPTMRPVGVVVYLDEMLYGNLESLRSIPLESVRVIRYFGSFDADLRWRGSHPAGAILVTTQRER
jgi:hypothetical protein